MGGTFMPAGPIAAAQGHLIITMVLLMLVVVVPMFITLFVVARKYRVSNKRTKKNEVTYEPERSARSGWSQLVLWAIPAALIAVLGVLNWQSTHALDPYASITAAGDIAPGAKTLEVEVVALPWKWLFIYPAQNIATVNFLEFPVNTPIHFELTADGPISSFWIPQLGSQIYAMAAMETQLNLLASKTGQFTGRDTEINGEGYSGMTFEADSVSAGDFAAWVASMQATSTPSTSTSATTVYSTLTPAAYTALAAPSENNSQAFYSSVTPDLFDDIIMKYMMPTPETGTSSTTSSSMNVSGMMQGMPGMN